MDKSKDAKMEKLDKKEDKKEEVQEEKFDPFVGKCWDNLH
jgi:hypothetical protein